MSNVFEDVLLRGCVELRVLLSMLMLELFTVFFRRRTMTATIKQSCMGYIKGVSKVTVSDLVQLWTLVLHGLASDLSTMPPPFPSWPG